MNQIVKIVYSIIIPLLLVAFGMLVALFGDSLGKGLQVAVVYICLGIVPLTTLVGFLRYFKSRRR